MLDPSIAGALKDHFSGLSSDVVFHVSPSDSPRQGELLEFLRDVAACGERLSVEEAGEKTSEVRFELHKNGTPTGIAFLGIPGGHEFTSLVLSVLNADGKGKLPDESLRRRVEALRGPIHLRTYVSLSCTNCPDVVQALNLMALWNPALTHEMVDGALYGEEIARDEVQAVPSVFADGTLLHVGRGTFGDLLERLEDRYGKAAAPSVEESEAPTELFDAAVVGGGPAGTTAAIYLARKGLKTALVAGVIGGQVRETVGIENLISVRQTTGVRLANDLTAHLGDYPVQVFTDRKVDHLRTGEVQTIVMKGGEKLRARRVIVATGAKWRELGIAGEKEYIGRGVAFCPHCDGPFYKGRRVAVVGGGNSGVEAAIDLAGICSHVTLFEYLDRLKADEVLIQRLKSLANVTVVLNARAEAVEGDGSAVKAFRYQDRVSGESKRVEIDGIFVQIGLEPNSAFLKGVVDLNPRGEVVVDAHGRTSVPGVYAAGDVTTVPYKQIVIAFGEGAKTALTAFEDQLREKVTA